MSTPAVSVILPSYNRARLLPRAIASVLGQSFGNFELLIVDDGSTDDTRSVVASHGDPRVRLLATSGRTGSAAARNFGIAQARGDWLAFQDSDDEWLPHKLEMQLDYARTLTEDYVLVGSGLLRHTPNAVELIRWPRRAGDGDRGPVDPIAFVRGMIAYLQSLILRRSAFERVGGFDAALKKSSDLELCLRLLREFRFAALDEALAISFETPGSVSQNHENACEAWSSIRKRHADLIATDRVARARYANELARSQLALGRRPAAASELLRSIAARPFQARAWAWLIATPLGLRAPAMIALLRGRRTPH
jgi:glycosyltransferase involved in cell wall biosynthesis